MPNAHERRLRFRLQEFLNEQTYLNKLIKKNIKKLNVCLKTDFELSWIVNIHNFVIIYVNIPQSHLKSFLFFHKPGKEKRKR